MRRDPLIPLGGWAVAAIAIVGYGVLAATLGEGFAIPTAVLGVIGTTIVLRGPLGKAIARRLEEDTVAPPDEVFAELDELRARVLELEERVDFSERLLARGDGVAGRAGTGGGA